MSLHWRARFQTVSKPLSRVVGIDFYSDKKLQAGEWRKQLDAAMNKSDAALFMVSTNFLASDFIMNEEVPYFLNASGYKSVPIGVTFS